jgi:ABC transporter substrate binding protein
VISSAMIAVSTVRCLIVRAETIPRGAAIELQSHDPAGIPVQRATKFELVINQQTAKTLGIQIPLSLLEDADEVIE